MRVSVITPCLNPGERISRCIRSVLAQTYADVEHVVVDGGSTDGTVSVLEEAGVRYVSAPDRGQTDAIAKGFELSSGALLSWLNADDELTPQAVERAVATGFEWVYGDCAVINGSRRSVWRPPVRFGAWEIEAGEMIAQPGTFFARSALDLVGGLDPSFDLTMDIDLWIRLVDAGIASCYVPEVLATFEIHPDSKTGSIGRKRFQLEHARALAKSGRYAAASAAVGRAAALGGALTPDELPDWADRKVVEAARIAEEGIEALRARKLHRAARLFSPRVVRVREGRNRMIASARRALRLG
jgi:glycosyltransferase involved in cell wall biosynthesis